MNSRPMTLDDLERVATMLKEDEEFIHGRPSQIGPNDLREWLARVNLPQDGWLYEDDGAVAGVGFVEVAPEGDVGVGLGIVHPRWKGRGLGAELLERAENALRARTARMHTFAFGADTAARDLILSRGFTDVRHFYDMAIEQTAPPPPVDLPVEPVTEADVPEFFAALDESFQDHWEHHSAPFEEWWERHRANPNLDLSLWFLIRDGEEVAAVTRNEGNRNGGGYIGAIGVRRPWRGKGYAKALLLHSFREFFERGMPRVTLGVDAANPTGATHLYERVGMHVEQENIVYEKALN